MKLSRVIRVRARIVAIAGGVFFLFIAMTAGAFDRSFDREVSFHGDLPHSVAVDPSRETVLLEHLASQRALRSEAQERLDELGARYSAETDRETRRQIAAEIRMEKVTLEHRNMEIGLEIATLRGQDDRAAEFAAALEEVTP